MIEERSVSFFTLVFDANYDLRIIFLCEVYLNNTWKFEMPANQTDLEFPNKINHCLITA